MSRCSERIFAAALAVFVALVGLSVAQAQQAATNPRIALVIGNATYRDVALATPANDAGLVAQTLQSAGFDVVGARDLDGQSLRTALHDFLQKAQAAGPDMQAFVYLSGRGVQYSGDNYFVPVDAQINRDADVPIEAIRVADFAHALAATPGKARIIVLDAARANPYAAQGSPLAPGLALVDPEAGELIAFNAAPGTLAGDEEGPYGVYGKTLAGAIRQGGVDIAQAFDQTRVSVNAETQGALVPWSASNLGGPFYVFQRAADAPPVAAFSPAQIDRRPISSFSAEDAYAAAIERDTLTGYREFLAAYPNSDQARRVRAILAVRREASYWRHTVRADTPRAYWTYLRNYPKGAHVADAQRRLTMLSAEFQPPPDFRPETYADLPPPPPDERFYEDRPIYAFDDFGPPPPPPPLQYIYAEDDDWRDLPPPPPPPDVGVLPVLGVAIPIAVGAVAYQGMFNRNGIVTPGALRFRPPPPAPPPLPANVKPVEPSAPPAVAAAPPANAAYVKPLRPIGRGGQPGGPPAQAPGAPANPGGIAAPAAPGAGPKPLSAPAASAPAQAAKPPVGPPAIGAGANGPANHVVPGGKPLPTPGAPPAAANAASAPASSGGKPLPVLPPGGGKPLPAPGAPPAPVAAPVSGKPAPPTANSGKPAPTPTAAPAVPAAPVTTGSKPAPAGEAPSAAAKAAAPVAPPAQTPKALPPAVNPAPRPNVSVQPPAVAPRAVVPPPSAPAALAPAASHPAPAPIRVPTAAPAPHPAPPAPPVVHPPQPAPVAPPPVVHAPPAPPAPPPVVRAPPPVVHVPPPPAPVVHAPPPAVAAPALRQPPPAVRVQPQVGQPPVCGRPGLPPCPK